MMDHDILIYRSMTLVFTEIVHSYLPKCDIGNCRFGDIAIYRSQTRYLHEPFKVANHV